MAIGAIRSVSHNPALALRVGALSPAAPAPTPEQAPPPDRTGFSDELTEERRAQINPLGPLGPSPTRPADNVDVLIQNLLGFHSEASNQPDPSRVPVAEVKGVKAGHDPLPTQGAEPAHGLQYTRGQDKVNVTSEAWHLR